MSCIAPALALLLAAHAQDVPLDLDLDEVAAASEDVYTSYPDLVATGDGTLHVLVADTVSDELRYTHDAAGAWSAWEVVSATSNVGPFNLEATLDADGRVAAVFDPGPGDVFAVARLGATGTWTVDDYATNARWMSLAFGADGSLHGAYSTGVLRYGTDASGAWVSEEVRGTGSFEERDPQLFFEDAATPSIAFVDRSDFSNPGIEVARRVGGSWTWETLTDDGEAPFGVVRGQDGTLHAVFVRSDTEGDRTWVSAVDDGDGWQETPTGLAVETTGVRSGSPLDVHLLEGGLLWADGEGGLRFVLGQAGGWRTFVAPLDASVRTVRLERAGDRLLALVGDDDNAVYVAELSLADDDDDDVPLAFDLCPDVADPDQADTDGDAVGDLCDCGDDGACTAWGDGSGWCDGSTPERTDPDCDPCELGPDADGDGVADACDGCPDDPDKTEPGACGCGVPETDDCPGDTGLGGEDDTEGCGCATGGTGTGLLFLAPLAVAGLRRRRGRGRAGTGR